MTESKCDLCGIITRYLRVTSDSHPNGRGKLVCADCSLYDEHGQKKTMTDIGNKITIITSKTVRLYGEEYTEKWTIKYSDKYGLQFDVSVSLEDNVDPNPDPVITKTNVTKSEVPNYVYASCREIITNFKDVIEL